VSWVVNEAKISLTKDFLAYYYWIMEAEINWHNGEAYEIAITQWLIRYLRDNDIRETHFSRGAGLGKNETDARTFRKIKEGKRHWSLIDLCKLAGYFGIKPSEILDRVESFVEKEGLVIPGKTVDRILDQGFAQAKPSPTLISTWQRKGKGFVFVDCDPDWKKASSNTIQRVVGMTSKQIFPYFPEVTQSFEQAWNEKGEDRIIIESGAPVEDRNQDKDETTGKRVMAINSRFVPPNFIVAYLNEVEVPP